MAQTPFGLNNPAAKLTTGAVQALMPTEPSRIIDPTLSAAFAEADAPKDPQPFQPVQTELDEQKKAAWIKSARDLADADLNAIDDIQAQALFINAVKNDPRFGYEDPDGTLTFGAESSFGRENARRMKRAMIDGDENALYSQKYRDFLALSEDEQLKQAEGENKPMTLSKPVPGYGGDPQSFAEPKPEKSADEKKTILDTYRNKLLSEQRTAAFTALTAPLSETARDWVTYSINSQTADPSTFALIPEHEQKFAAAAVALQRRTANVSYGSIVGIEFGRAVSALATGGTEFMSDQLARARNLRNAEARGLDLSEVDNPNGNPADWKARQIVQDVRHDGKELDRRTQIRTQLEEAREQLLPESGFAGNIPRGVISSLPYMAAVSNPFTGTLAVLGMANDSRERMIAEGVDGETASVVGLASGAIQSWIEKAQLNTIIGGKLTELELRKLTMGQFGKVLAAKDWSLLGTEIQRRGSVAVRSWASELAEETAQGLTDEIALQTGNLITTGTADIRPIVANTLQTFIDSAPATLGFGLMTGSGIGPSIGTRMRGGAITGAEMADLAGKYRSAASALQGLLEESPEKATSKTARTEQLMTQLRTDWSKAKTDADKRQTLFTAGLAPETADLIHETFTTENILADTSAEARSVLWTQRINADINPETLLQIPNIVRAESVSPTETKAVIQLADGKETELLFRYGATGRAADPARFDSQLRNAIGPDLWDNADEEQRNAFRQDTETNTKAFYVTAPGSTSSIDSKGIITLTSETETPATLDDLYHETFHAATELALKSGILTEGQIQTLRTVYGEAANAGEMFDTEEAAIAYAQHLAGRKTKTSGIFQSILDFLSSIRNTVFGRRESIPANATASEIFDLIAEGRLDQLPAEALKTQEETPTPEVPAPSASSESIQQPVPSTDGGSSITQPELIPKPKRTPQWKAVTPQGNITVAGDWEIRDLDSLVSSDLDAYDQTLQPRDRTSLGSKERIHTIAADFQPDRLFDSAETDGGSPIVVGNQILSGNGRTLVLRRLVQLKRFGEYQKAMKAKAAELGLEIPAGMKHPVLVRVGKLRTGKDATWAKVAELSNRNKILTRTPAEQAEADAKTIRDNKLLDLFVPSQEGNILAATNRNFINAFVQRTGDAGLLDSKGNPTDGLETRIERALLAVLTDADRDTIKSLLETSLPIRQAVSGLISAAPDILALATDKPAYDLRPEIAAALKKYLDFKRSEVKNIDEFLAQTDMLAVQSPEVDALTRQLATATPAQLGDFFRTFSRLARAVNTETEDLFGAAPATKADLLSRAGEDTRFSLRTKPAPKETGIGYKVFYRKDGKLYPPMVANPNGIDTPVDVWLDADSAPIATTSKTGRPKVKSGGKGTQGGGGTLAFRPGWHLGEIPYATQFNRVNPETGERNLFPKDFVWAEVSYSKDKNYQKEAEKSGQTENGKFRHSYAGLQKVPEDGYYTYRTNPDPTTDPWIITGSMKVNRILSREEVDAIVSKAGRIPQKVETTDIRFNLRITPEQDKAYLDAVESGDMKTAQKMVDDAAKANGYTIKAFHATDKTFSKFERDFLGLVTEQNTNQKQASKMAKLGFWFSDHDIRNHTSFKHSIPVYLNLGKTNNTTFDSQWNRARMPNDSLTVKDSEFGGMSYVVKNPSQIKSADPVTKDDAGNIIPLSERFNEQTPDIRYSMGRGYFGFSKSNNAMDAEANGRFPATVAAKKLGVTADAIRMVLTTDEWHHTSKEYNITPYYDISNLLDPQTDEDSKLLAELKSYKKKAPIESDPRLATFNYIEWAGTKSRPKAIEKKLENVYVQEKGKFYIVRDAEGKQIVRKMIGSNGTSVFYTQTAEEKNSVEESKKDWRSVLLGRMSEKAREFYLEKGEESFVESTSGHMYIIGRKPTQTDVQNGLDKFFSIGEKSLGYDRDNRTFSLRTWNGTKWVDEAESARYSVKLGADNLNTLITAALATRITRGEKIGIADAERLTRNLNIGSTPSQILDQAKQLADANAGRLEQFAQKTDAQLYQTLVNLKMRDNYIRALRTADEQGFAEGRKLQGDLNKIRSIKDLTLKREIESVEGIPTSEIELSFGIDIAQSVVNSVYPAAEEKDKNRIARPGADIPPELAGTPAAATVDGIPEPLQKLIDSATRKAEAEQHTRDKDKLAAEASTAETPDPETVQPAPAPSTDGSQTARAKTPFQNPIQFRAFIEELVLHHLQQNPDYSAKDPFAKPANIRLYALTAQNILTDLARKLTYSYARENITKDLEELPGLAIKTTLDRQIEHLYARITRNTIKESQEQLTATLERDIRRTALTGPQFGGSKPELDRKIQTLKERFARNVLAYLRLTPLQIEEETNRLQNILTTQAQEIEGVADYSANEDRDYQNALDQLNALTNFGGIRYMTPGEIQDKSTQIIRYIGESAEQLAAEREERAMRNGRAIYDLSLAIRNPADLATPKPNIVKDWINSAIVIYDLKLLDLIRFAKGTTYSAAKAVIDDISTLNSLAAQQKSIYVQTQTELMRKTFIGIYGSEKAAIKRLAETCENWKSFSNQNQVMTIGQALQLYGSIVQKDYQFNARAHKRDGQRLEALKSNFTAKEYALLQAMRLWYRTNRQYLDQSYIPIIGMPVLSPGTDYIPIKTYQEPKGFKARVKAWTLIPPGLISRVRHSRDFDEKADIFGLWHERLEQSAHFAAYAQNGLDISAILGNNTVQDTIVRNHGEEVLKSVLNHTVDILSGRLTTTSSARSQWLANVSRTWVSWTSVSGSVGSMLKQVAGFPSVALHPDVNTHHFISGLIKPNFEIIKQLLKSDGYTARYGEGASEEIAHAMRMGKGTNPIAKLYTLGFEIPQFGDRIVGLICGQAIYPDFYNTLRNQGYSHPEAVKRAEARTWSVIEENQQSRRIENLSEIQREGGAWGKMLYQFVSNPSQQLAFEVAAVKLAKANPTYENISAALRTILLNHAVTPATMALVAAIMRAVTGSKDDDDDEDENLQARVYEAVAYIVTGPFSGLFLAGSIGESVITGLMTGKRPWGQTGLPVMRIVENASTLGITAHHLVTLDGEKLGKDFRRVLKDVSAPTRLGVTFYENRIMDDE